MAYTLKNLHKLDEIPIRLRSKIFEHLFEQAEVAKFDKKQRIAYEDSLKEYRDLSSAIETAKEEAREEGHAEGHALEQGLEQGREEGELQKSVEVAKNAILKNLDNHIIISLTGLSEAQIQTIRNENESLGCYKCLRSMVYQTLYFILS